MLVSVYMPTKNRAQMMLKAAASVLNQTHREIELLVVDDGSTDDTPAQLQSLARQDARMRVFRNEVSRGAPHSRNTAIAAASGRWITGIDDDDEFHPERLASLLAYWQLLESARIEFSGLYTQDIYDDGVTQTQSAKRGSVAWQNLFEFNTVGPPLFTLTSRIRDCGSYDDAMPAWQDLDLYVRLLKKFGTARLLDAPMYRVNMEERSDRISKSKKERIVAAFDRLVVKHPEISGAVRQRLYLQVFGKLYGHRPGLQDWRRFMSYGWNFQNARRFVARAVGRPG